VTRARRPRECIICATPHQYYLIWTSCPRQTNDGSEDRFAR
jgi:hypothetical protein